MVEQCGFLSLSGFPDMTAPEACHCTACLFRGHLHHLKMLEFALLLVHEAVDGDEHLLAVAHDLIIERQSGLCGHLLQGFEDADYAGSFVDEFSKALLGCIQHLGADGFVGSTEKVGW